MPLPVTRTRQVHLASIATRGPLLIAMTTCIMLALSCPAASAAAGEQAIRLVVPVDHDRPDAGTWTLTYLLAGPFDAARPTVFVVADGQQFFLRPGRMDRVAARTCRGPVNLVGIPGRIIAEELIDLVTGDDARILIAGTSGGGMLVQEYLTRYGEHCARGDRASLDEACQRYQVDAVHELVAGGQGLGVAVRMFEFYQPILQAVDLDDARFHPTLEMAAALARPLFAAHSAGLVPAPDFPVDRLATVNAEVFLLAGRWDQPVDWRTQQDLAGLMPRSMLFLADDDHLFKGLKGSGLDADLREAFLLHGLGSSQLAAVLARAEANRWRPGA